MKSFPDVWEALTDSPEEAATMRLRADVMVALSDTIKGWKVTQAAAANRLGVSQPRLNDMLRGRIDKFSLDALLTLAARAGLSVRLQVGAAA
jgi:predicted XRE-type DNA-binding protein